MYHRAIKAIKQATRKPFFRDRKKKVQNEYTEEEKQKNIDFSEKIKDVPRNRSKGKEDFSSIVFMVVLFAMLLWMILFSIFLFLLPATGS